MAVQDRPRYWQLVVTTAFLIQSGWLSAGFAQAGSRLGVSPGAEASFYDRLYEELISLRPQPQAVAAVSELVLRRDVGRFTFESGNFYLLKPVGGRVVGGVFVGKGTFSFAPPTAMERERLAFFEKTQNLVGAPECGGAPLCRYHGRSAAAESQLSRRPGLVRCGGSYQGRSRISAR